ncbi:unnamed protein product [Caenorhabditis auriculariae]|uniref:G-protein coupled receptors family 1 profile domain-containing protein n=1 Tax=Caenorhabditis auriculariae TaxID=2777116 RepID=A0A8S1H7K0_9PELO|nr:unnamed protein product [Caenorhabditis auriculariae]
MEIDENFLSDLRVSTAQALNDLQTELYPGGNISEFMGNIRLHCHREDVAEIARQTLVLWLHANSSTVGQSFASDDSLPILAKAFLSVIFVIVGCIGLVGNVLTVLVIYNTASLHSHTNYFLASLACSDLCLIVIGVPFDLFHIWRNGEPLLIAGYCSFTSKVLMLIYGIWIVAAIPSIYIGLRLTMIVTFVLPLIFIIFCYIRILATLNEVSAATTVHTPVGTTNSDSSQLVCCEGNLPVRGSTHSNVQHFPLTVHSRNYSTPRSQQAQKMVIKMLVTVTSVFFLCYLPYHLQRLIVQYTKQNCKSSIFCLLLYPITGLLQYISATLNPIFYNLMSGTRMSLSRLAPVGQNARIVIIPARFAHHAVTPVTAAPADDTPNFFQKIALRFKGVPLKGETHAPKSMFDDVGKEWSAPEPLPAIPKDFKEHPDRDLVNYPYPARPMYPPKTRVLMIPDSWFTAFHKVTGVSGPYLFYGGLFAFLVNKELWVYEEQGHMTVGWILFYLLISRSVGFKIDNWLYGEYQNRMNYFKGLIAEDLKDAVEFRKTSAAQTESLNAIKEALPNALKESMQLQLEATYRKNVETISTELKRRLDYLKQTEETKARF